MSFRLRFQAVGLLKTLHQGDYHVTVIAPQNYSLFTPLLPSATVGTVEARSLVEPLRRTLARVHGTCDDLVVPRV